MSGGWGSSETLREFRDAQKQLTARIDGVTREMVRSEEIAKLRQEMALLVPRSILEYELKLAEQSRQELQHSVDALTVEVKGLGQKVITAVGVVGVIVAIIVGLVSISAHVRFY
jgi:hypothetical protein